MYSDQEDENVQVFGGARNDYLLEDWLRNDTRKYVSEGYKPSASENSRPWTLPGADPADFFNFGFTETTWKKFMIENINKRRKQIYEKEIEEQNRRFMQPFMPQSGDSKKHVMK